MFLCENNLIACSIFPVGHRVWQTPTRTVTPVSSVTTSGNTSIVCGRIECRRCPTERTAKHVRLITVAPCRVITKSVPHVSHPSRRFSFCNDRTIVSARTTTNVTWIPGYFQHLDSRAPCGTLHERDGAQGSPLLGGQIVRKPIAMRKFFF